MEPSHGSCVIHASPMVDATILEAMEGVLNQKLAVKRRTLLQATGGVPPEAIYIVISFIAGSINSGFFNSLGEDVYHALRNTILSRLFNAQGKERTIDFAFKAGNTEISFKCTTDDPTIIQAALDAIPQIVRGPDRSMEYYFNNETLRWEE
jgi:hypothetical protein